MTEVILETAQQVESPTGVRYQAQVHGQQRRDGTWEGWIAFVPRPGAGSILRTARETTQPNRQALIYWASGLESVYYDGAFARPRGDVAADGC